MISFRLVKKYEYERIKTLAQRLADFESPIWRDKTEIIAGDLRVIERYFKNDLPSSWMFAACENGEVLGFILFELRKDFFNQEDVMYIADLAVDKNAAGKGIGRSLVKLAEQESSKLGISSITLNVFQENSIALHMYRSLGYHDEVVGMIKIMNHK